MSFSHLLILGIIAVIVIPPDKLPEVARQVARFLGELRRMSSGIFDDLQKDPGPQLKPEDNLKRYEQQAQTQSSQASETTAVTQPSPEQQKKDEDVYLKHIQGESSSVETATQLEQKKSTHE